MPKETENDRLERLEAAVDDLTEQVKRIADLLEGLVKWAAKKFKL